MKRISGITLLIALLSLPLFAAKNSQQFLLPSDVRIGDVQLREGHCQVSWNEASGSQVQLTIKTQDRKTITVPAQLIEKKQNNPGVQTFVQNGVAYVSEFDTANFRLVVQEPQAGTR